MCDSCVGSCSGSVSLSSPPSRRQRRRRKKLSCRVCQSSVTSCDAFGGDPHSCCIADQCGFGEPAPVPVACPSSVTPQSVTSALARGMTRLSQFDSIFLGSLLGQRAARFGSAGLNISPLRVLFALIIAFRFIGTSDFGGQFIRLLLCCRDEQLGAALISSLSSGSFSLPFTLSGLTSSGGSCSSLGSVGGGCSSLGSLSSVLGSSSSCSSLGSSSGSCCFIPGVSTPPPSSCPDPCLAPQNAIILNTAAREVKSGEPIQFNLPLVGSSGISYSGGTSATFTIRCRGCYSIRVVIRQLATPTGTPQIVTGTMIPFTSSTTVTGVIIGGVAETITLIDATVDLCANPPPFTFQIQAVNGDITLPAGLNASVNIHRISLCRC
jgi:hypothetical protein